MSALGHNQTYALQQAMSALHPIATAKATFRKRPCLLYPESGHVRCKPSCLLWADSGHSDQLFNQLVGANLQRQRQLNPKRLGGLQIDEELLLRGQLNREIDWLGTF